MYAAVLQLRPADRALTEALVPAEDIDVRVESVGFCLLFDTTLNGMYCLLLQPSVETPRASLGAAQREFLLEGAAEGGRPGLLELGLGVEGDVGWNDGIVSDARDCCVQEDLGTCQVRRAMMSLRNWETEY